MSETGNREERALKACFHHEAAPQPERIARARIHAGNVEAVIDGREGPLRVLERVARARLGGRRDIFPAGNHLDLADCEAGFAVKRPELRGGEAHVAGRDFLQRQIDHAEPPVEIGGGGRHDQTRIAEIRAVCHLELIANRETQVLVDRVLDREQPHRIDRHRAAKIQLKPFGRRRVLRRL